MTKPCRKSGLRIVSIAVGGDVLLASFGINLLSLGLPIVVLQVYDRVLPNAAIESFQAMIIALGVALLLEAGLRLARSGMAAWAAAKYEHAAGTAAFDRLLAADLAGFEREPPGVHLDRVEAIDVLRDFQFGQATLLLADLPFALLFVVLLWLIAGWLVVVPLGLLLLFGAVSVWLAATIRHRLEARTANDRRRHSFLIETLGAVHVVKAMALEGPMMRRHERLQSASAETVAALGRLSAAAAALGTVASHLSLFAVAAAGALATVAGDMTLGAVAASGMLAGRMLQPTLRALALWTQVQSLRLAQRSLAEVMALPQEAGVGRPGSPEPAGEIELRGVSLRAGRQGRWLLHRADLLIRPGEMIGITGSNGTGKTTLLGSLMALTVPEEGQVLIDGHDLATVDPAVLRTRIGFMAQHATLFQGTVLDNLTMFRDDPEVVRRAIDIARRLALDEVMTRLPRGLDTRVGDGIGDALPEGVRQRIGMARAMAGDPPILLFDDANAALDMHSDELLRRLLAEERGRRTIVLVSHRPSLLSLCDRRFALADGALKPLADADAHRHEAAA